MTILQFKVRDLGLTHEVLYGGVLGRKAADKLLRLVPPSARNQVVLIDFAGVRAASASFLREALLGVKYPLARRQLVLVVANANETILDDLSEMLQAREETTLVCDLDDNSVTNAKVLGPLDVGQRKTLEAAEGSNEITAQQLNSLFPDEGIGITAWNNRLAALAARGLLLERRKGRQKIYSALSRSISNGA